VVRSVVTNAQGSIYFRGSRVVEVTRDVRWVDRPSFYVEYGDWFVAACAVLAVFGVLLLRSSEGQSVGNPAEPSETSQKLN
jgi:apolipoprotein N-acyltransferase